MKTDWKAADYYNAEDYARLTAALGAVGGLYGLTNAYPAGTAATVLTREDRAGIAGHFNAVARAAGREETVDPAKPVWFDSAELNRMEGVLEYLSRHYLEDSRRAAVIDAKGRAVTLERRGYRSAWPGERMDELAENAREGV